MGTCHLRGTNTPHYALLALPQSRAILEDTSISTLTTWINKEYKNFQSVKHIENEEEIVDDEAICSVSTAFEIANRFRDSLKPAFQIIVNEITSMKNNKGTLEDTLADYATIDDVNNVLKKYTQLTHLEENYLTKGQIEETYCNFDELTELFYDKKDIDAKEKTLNDKITANTTQLTTLTAKVNDFPTNKSFTGAINGLSNGMNHYYLITDADAKFATKEEFTSMGTNIDKKFNDCATKSQLKDYLLEVNFDVIDEQYDIRFTNLENGKADKSALGDLQQDVQTIASTVNTIGTTYATKEEFTAMGMNFDEKLGGYLKNNANGTLTGSLTINGGLTTTGLIHGKSDILLSNNGTTSPGIYLRGATNDAGWMRIYGGSNAGNLEIAIGDDGAEPIYIRQYQNSKTGSDSYANYPTGTPKRTLTLLDASGNTSIPGTTTIAGNLTVNGSIVNNTLNQNLVNLANRISALEANCISKDMLTSIFTKSLMHQRTYIKTIDEYNKAAEPYLDYLLVSGLEFELFLKEGEFNNERFLVIYWNNGRMNQKHDEEGFLIVYDFVSMKGHLCLFTSSIDFDYRVYDFTATINNNQIDIFIKLDAGMTGQHMVSYDDILADIGCYCVQFFDIIHKSDEETELSQLNASLMKLSHIMNS